MRNAGRPACRGRRRRRRRTCVYKVGEPYQINGTWYYPAEDLSYDETGIASWYGEEFHGKYTANGEVFDLNALDGRAPHPADAERGAGDQSR